MTVIFLTTTGASTWSIPSGVTSIKVECIGGGAGGGTDASGSSAGGGGGGGGAYSATNAITVSVGNTLYLNIGIGGGAQENGGDTWARYGTNSVPSSTADGCLAKGGLRTTGVTGGSGGSSTSSVGDVKYAGGKGGNCGDDDGGGGAGGGGAGGPTGIGRAGGNSGADDGSGGGGGGGSNGGSSTVGANSSSTTAAGAAGGNGTSGAGAGSAGSAGIDANGGVGGDGTSGGGGGGGGGVHSSSAYTAGNGGAGGSDTAFDASHGSGGGGGGGGGNETFEVDAIAGDGGNGGLYGGGGGSGGDPRYSDAAYIGSNGSGAQGLIVITYTAEEPAEVYVLFGEWSPQIRPACVRSDPGGEKFVDFFYEAPPAPPAPAFGGMAGFWPLPLQSDRKPRQFSEFVQPQAPPEFEPTAFSQWEGCRSPVGTAKPFQDFVVLVETETSPRSEFSDWPPSGRTKRAGQAFSGFVRLTPGKTPVFSEWNVFLARKRAGQPFSDFSRRAAAQLPVFSEWNASPVRKRAGQSFSDFSRFAAVRPPVFSEWSRAHGARRSAQAFSDFSRYTVSSSGGGVVFQEWALAATASRDGSSFQDFLSVPETPEVVYPVFSGFPDGASKPRTRPSSDFIDFAREVAPPAALTPLSFDEWPGSHKAVHSPVEFSVFERDPGFWAIVEPDAVRRPKHKVVRKSRFDYSLYNHPEFDAIHGEQDEAELTEDELDDIRIEVINELLEELGVPVELIDQVEDASPGDPQISIEIESDEDAGTALPQTRQRRAEQDRLDVVDAVFGHAAQNHACDLSIDDILPEKTGENPAEYHNDVVDMPSITGKDFIPEDIYSAMEYFFGDGR